MANHWPILTLPLLHKNQNKLLKRKGNLKKIRMQMYTAESIRFRKTQQLFFKKSCCVFRKRMDSAVYICIRIFFKFPLRFNNLFWFLCRSGSVKIGQWFAMD